jgi:hypothetical protein
MSENYTVENIIIFLQYINIYRIAFTACSFFKYLLPGLRLVFLYIDKKIVWREFAKMYVTLEVYAQNK